MDASGHQLCALARPGLGLLAAFFGVFGATGCVFVVDEGVEGSGHLSDDVRVVSGFDRVHAAGGVEVEVFAGEPLQVAVSGDDNLVGYVSTVVDDDGLHVRLTEDVAPRAGLRVVVRVPTVGGLAASGGSRLQARAVANEEVELEVSGASRLTVAGQAPRGKVRVSGGSVLEARSLVLRQARVDLSGASQADLTVVDSLTGDASGASRLQVWGLPPTLTVKASGGAVVRRMP